MTRLTMGIDFMNSRVQDILRKSLPQTSVVRCGKYTEPPTWGVYKISAPQSTASTRRYRFGNHPIRQQELSTEFSAAELLALFQDRADAIELARLLNSGLAIE